MMPAAHGNPPLSRVRAFGYFVIAVIYFFFSQTVAHAVSRLFPGLWPELIERLLLVALLLIGYGFMGRAFQEQDHPLAAMGLAVRRGWREEFGRGAALGWGMLVACILPMLFTGGLLFSFYTSSRQYMVLLFDLVVLAVAALAEEIAFRGYPFQRLIDAIGPFWATLVLSAVFGLAHIFNPSSTAISIVVTMVAGWFLSIAYLRTRALWLPWGWHFAWNASMALLFGLPISGLTRFSPVVQSDTIGPSWLTGGYYGPEASIVTLIVMLAAIPVLLRVTRSYASRRESAVLIPAPATPWSGTASSGAPVSGLDTSGEAGPSAVDPRATVIVPAPEPVTRQEQEAGDDGDGKPPGEPST